MRFPAATALGNAAAWGVPAARLDRPRSLENRAALAHERQTFAGSLRFYGRCGMALDIAGAAGFAWEAWRG